MVPIEWEAGWAAGQSGCFGEDKNPLPLPGFEPQTIQPVTYIVGSKSFWPDQLFKVTEIKQLCYFST